MAWLWVRLFAFTRTRMVRQTDCNQVVCRRMRSHGYGAVCDWNSAGHLETKHNVLWRRVLDYCGQSGLRGSARLRSLGWNQPLEPPHVAVVRIHQFQMRAFDFVDHWIAKFVPAYYARMSGDLGVLTVRFVASSAVAITAAFLSRRYFEERFLRLKDRLLLRPAAKAVDVSAPAVQQAAEESG
jgi:hypothetical protein